MTHLTLIIVLAFSLFPFISPTMKCKTTLRHVGHKIENATKIERLRQALVRSRLRLQWLRVASNHTDVEGPITFYGQPYGEYLMHISFGTPPVSLPLIMEMSRSLTWIQCGPCQECSNLSTPIFKREKSSTYSALRCPNPICTLNGFSICKERPCGSKCTYNFTYADGTMTQGELATETLWFEANTIPIQGLLIRCRLNDPGHLWGSAGTMGFARGNDSLVSQLNISAFSYCLPSVMSNETGRFFMGCEASAPPGALTTPLRKNPPYPAYYLNLQGISINGVPVPFNKTAFVVAPDGLGGMVIDSGTSFTYLETSTFEAVVREFARQVRLPRVIGPYPDLDIGLDLCFNVSKHDLERIWFPKFVLHFEGADLELPRDNYFLLFEELGIGCLSMIASDMGVSILGNIQLQNMVVVYDLTNDKVSFLPNTKCEDM